MSCAWMENKNAFRIKRAGIIPGSLAISGTYPSNPVRSIAVLSPRYRDRDVERIHGRGAWCNE